MTEDKGDLREVRIEQEKSRLRPAQRAAQLRQARLLRQMEQLLKRGTEEDVIEAIKAVGMRPDSPEGQHVLRVWRENRY